MANQLLTISMITRESLRVLENSLTFTPRVRRDFDDKYGIEGAKIGTVLNIRKPPRYLGRVGQALQIEDATETSVPLTLTTQRGVDIAFTSQDFALSIDDFTERFLKAGIANVANNVDFDGLSQYVNVFNEIGTPGTVPNAALTYLQVGQRLDEEATPRDGERSFVISPAMQATGANALLGLLNPQKTIGKIFKKGLISEDTLGADWYMDQNVRTQLVGLQGGTPIVNAANQTGNSVTTSGWTATTVVLNIGDVVSFGTAATGSHAVNPQNKQSTGALRQFVVTAPVTSNGGGVATIPISGPGGLGIVTAGPFQTVDVSPPNNASVNVQGASATNSPRGLGFHKDAFAFACADLPLWEGVHKAERMSDKQLGMSIRLICAYDINLDRAPWRFDILYGWQTIYPELACRIAS